MSLHTMNRYMGDDLKPKKSLTIEDINRQAKLKKRQRDSELIQSSTSNGEKKATKKRKVTNNEEDQGTSEKPSKKLLKDEVPVKAQQLEDSKTVSLVKKSKSKKKRIRNKNKLLIDNDTNDSTVENGNFPVIGEDLDLNVQKVKRVLPEWLVNPDVISSDLHSQLTPINEIIGLHQSIITALEKNGITHFFPVQSRIIPWLLKNSGRDVYRPKDLCVSSPTGSGKTLAYALPIIQALRERVICNIKAVVVLPVRDLATQVHKVFQTFCEGSGLKVGLAIGQTSFHHEQNLLIRKGYRRYHSLVDILVCTPGRLVDHINETPGFSLRDLRILVIDEADRMMQHIKQGWLSHVDKCVYGCEGMENIPMVVSRLHQIRNIPQKLLFSATLSHNPEKLQQMKLFQPKLFTSIISSESSKKDVENGDIPANYIGKYITPQELKEHYVVCTPTIKPLVLLHMIHNLNYRYILVFTNSVESAHRLCLLLYSFGGINVKELSSNLHVRKREKALQKFSQGSVDVLVCSDAIARGIDIENVRYVISYDKPPFLKTYIHRAGRTARAGRLGTALTFIQNHEVSEFKNMLQSAKQSLLTELTVTPDELKNVEDKYSEALERVAEIVAGESHKRKF